ncbi:MAG: cobalt ECF transporter T component CbiQ [Coriobacteriales bacterium]|nr:cobalt ECF transporter T component CbiQ [Coriobacteriales bacterium]
MTAEEHRHGDREAEAHAHPEGADAGRLHDDREHALSVHRHEHEHDGETHAHPHHHRALAVDAHEHAHALGFERHTYLSSPVHQLDPRFKIVAAALVIMGVVLGPPARGLEFLLFVALVSTLSILARIPLGWMFVRSAIVLPIAGGIALFAPLAHATSFTASGIATAYASGWPTMWTIVSKAWMSAFVVLLVSASTPPPVLFHGLKALRMPSIFLTMLTFLYRYVDVLRDQLRSMRRAVASRGWNVRGTGLIRLYGNLAGNLFIRAYERGERVYASMLSRGYDGTLPSAEELTASPADYLLVATSMLVVAALLLY